MDLPGVGSEIAIAGEVDCRQARLLVLPPSARFLRNEDGSADGELLELEDW